VSERRRRGAGAAPRTGLPGLAGDAVAVAGAWLVGRLLPGHAAPRTGEEDRRTGHGADERAAPPVVLDRLLRAVALSAVLLLSHRVAAGGTTRGLGARLRRRRGR
jgi:hypothetical protein